jgi:hypothetical protein
MKKGLFLAISALGLYGFVMAKQEVSSFLTQSSYELNRAEKYVGDWLKKIENGCKKCGKPKK